MTKTLSNAIKQCRDGAANNPFQGTDKKVLFVCSMGILRSATAARLYASRHNTRSCGTWDDALIPFSVELLKWANQIVFVNKNNWLDIKKNYADWLPELKEKSVILNIPDNFEHMHPRLVAEFNTQYEPVPDHWKTI